MSCDKEGGNLEQFERNKYFYGKLMTVRDFETEQNYFNEKRHLLNRLIHGIGIVCGFDKIETDPDGANVSLSPGVAIDCCGREIVVDKEDKYLVNGTFKDKDTNCLYLKYAECEKEPVPVPANASSCEEVCCNNRIGETFELVWGTAPDEKSVLGVVKDSKSAGIIKDTIIEAFQNGTSKTKVKTDVNGEYGLSLLPGKYIIKISAKDYETKSIYKEINSPIKLDVSLDKTTDSKDQWENLPTNYFEEDIYECPECKDPQVLLAVIQKIGNDLKINASETEKYRAVVYNNPLLYELLSSHLIDFNNPHNVTAEQAGALVSVEGLSNPGGNVDLDKGGAITISTTAKTSTADPKITIGETHSSIKSGNPHQVTATEVGALKSVKGLSNPGGNINIEGQNNITITTETPQNADPKIIISSQAGVDPALIEQVDTISQYLRERALKCAVISFRGITSNADMQQIINKNIVVPFRSAVDKKIYLDPDRFNKFFEKAIGNLKEVIGVFKELECGNIEKFQEAVDDLSKVLGEDSLKIAAAMDEVCFYTQLLECKKLGK
jgi:hypothetical protein